MFYLLFLCNVFGGHLKFTLLQQRKTSSLGIDNDDEQGSSEFPLTSAGS